jgi:hypothetical protein
VKDVLAAMLRTQGEDPEADWWECFMAGDGDPPVPPTKPASTSRRGAGVESLTLRLTSVHRGRTGGR